MKEATLVIMAAGMGSRFGGLKQIESVDRQGHILIDYSVYDAIRAGFRSVVFIIKKEIEADFKKIISPRIKKWGIKVSYVFQEIDSLPEGFTPPDGRKKPWGTAHAIACLDGAITTPFAVINADDYYGPSAFKSINDFLMGDTCDCAMVGYRLKNTLSENGGVSRGVCRVENGYLTEICEICDIRECDSIIVSEGQGAPIKLDGESVVSMNLWGFRPEIIRLCNQYFVNFLNENSQKSLNVCEFYITSVVSRLISEGEVRVKVIESNDRWYGITYREDREGLSTALHRLVNDGAYPGLTKKPSREGRL